MLLPKFLSRKKLSRKYRSIFASKPRPATGVKTWALDLSGGQFLHHTCVECESQSASRSGEGRWRWWKEAGCANEEGVHMGHFQVPTGRW